MDELLDALDDIGAETEDAIDRFMGDEEMYVKYVREFPQEKSMGMLVEAVANKDYDQAEKSVHALKGIVNNLSFLPLADATVDMLAELRGNNIDDALEAFEDVKEQYQNFCEVIEKYCD